MSKHKTLLFISALMVLALCGGDALAMDAAGCLTCHQYPGLTRPEEPTGFKVFHIDEMRFLKSPHGAVGCRKCHTTVHKVPHVGETAVNCTNGCHQEKKDKKRIADFNLATLHAGEKSYITRLADGSSCRECHRLFPHHSNLLARAFINMHIGYMTCDTCHINRDKYKHLSYAWTDSETAEFAGKPFGTRANPNIVAGSHSAHFISRIAVFTEEKGKKRAMLNTQDTPLAKEFLAQEAQLSAGERKARLAYFHRDVHKTAISATCNECHAKKNTILDFRDLGYSKKKATDLIYLNIKGLVTKYKVFYFPDLFRQ
jgi:hypothetical protein